MKLKDNKHQYFVKICDLCFGYREHNIFDNINMNIPRVKLPQSWDQVVPVKPHFKLISAALKPRTGTILVDGIPIHQLSRLELYQMRRRMGVLFQSGALFPELNVFENVAFPLREHTNLPEEMIHDLVLMKLQAVGLRGAKNLKPSQLSGGMSRRVALARCLALDPDLLMYDEPFTGQNPITKSILVNLIQEINRALQITSIVVSHDVIETC